MTEDEMVEWHHHLYRHELEQTPVVGDEQGSLACCSPWDCKESDMTELLTELNKTLEKKIKSETCIKMMYNITTSKNIFQYQMA